MARHGSPKTGPKPGHARCSLECGRLISTCPSFTSQSSASDNRCHRCLMTRQSWSFTSQASHQTGDTECPNFGVGEANSGEIIGLCPLGHVLRPPMSGFRLRFLCRSISSSS